jgi:CRISPR-associated endoribonuclease Cas6
MRFRVDVAAREPQIAWPDVHGPVRAVAYSLIGSKNPELARELHDAGWRGSPLRPVGMSPPVFRGAPRKPGAYMTSADGSLWLGSPVPDIAVAMLRAAADLTSRTSMRWGRSTLAVKGVQLGDLPDHNSGQAVFESATPVLVKHEDRFLLPGDPLYLDRLSHNLRHKADLLGLPADHETEILDAGPRRRFEVAGKPRIGATIRVRVTAAPALLDALYDWGLGLLTIQGFGWLQ